MSIAFLVMSHLRTQVTTQDLTGRLRWKLSLIKRMYETGYSKDKIIKLFRLVDRLMALPPDLDLEFNAELDRFEADQEMTYITSVERIGRARATQESIATVLEARFDRVPPELVEQLNQIYDIDLLKRLLKQAITIQSLAQFQEQFRQENTGS